MDSTVLNSIRAFNTEKVKIDDDDHDLDIILSNIINEIDEISPYLYTHLAADDKVDEKARKLVFYLYERTKILDKKISDLENQNIILREYCDKDLNDFIISIEKELDSYGTCTEAIRTYGLDWFSSLPFSENGIKEIASMLIRSVEPYDVKPSQLWIDIANGNPYTLMVINGTVNTDSEGTDLYEENVSQ